LGRSKIIPTTSANLFIFSLMKFKYSFFTILMIFFLSAAIFFYNYFLKENKAVISIAFAGPLSGHGATAGKLMTQAIQLYFDHINQAGGINGKKVILERFDDSNDPTQAKQKALEIVEKNRAVAVIGHWYSSTSLSAGKIYKKYGIPAITPGSTNIEVTQNNDWYFRNIFNARTSGKFLAHYVKKIFKQNTATVICEEGAYGAYLAKVFKEEAKKLNMDVNFYWTFNTNDTNLNSRFQQIVKQLGVQKETAGVIFLATQAVEGVKLVKLIKEAGIKNTIISETSFSEKNFLHGFDAFPKEQANPGYYTNDIYVATPLIFDTANEKAQQFWQDYQTKYQEEPDWSAAYAYDTAMVVINAIRNAQIEGQTTTLKSDRQKIRNYLANLNHIHKAIDGVTGFNYFDKSGNAQKPVVMGVYKNKNLISALTQLQPIRHLNEISDLEKAMREEQVLLVDDKYLYKTNVVYTGIEINKITELDIKNLTYNLEFNLWFRFRGEMAPENIKFFNAVEPIFLKKPVLIEKQGQMTYHLYKLKGKFRADFHSSWHFAFNRHILGVSFHHQDFTRNNLIYVIDVLGMGLTKKESLLDRLQKQQVLNPIFDWTIQHVWFFEDIIKKTSLGNFKYLSLPNSMIQYSRFNMGIQIKKNEFGLRGIIPLQWAYHLVILSSLMILLLIILDKNKKLKTFSNFFKKTSASIVLPDSISSPLPTLSHLPYDSLIWLLQAFFSFFLLLSGEIVLLALTEGFSYHPTMIVKLFDISWWLISAMFINLAINRFIWRSLEKRSGRSIPNVIQIFVTFVVYLLALFGIIAFVYEQTLTSLLATSGMVAMIIGLAIQANLSNIFSGVAINLERPFRVGDWVKIGSYDEGIVIDVNWRTTRLKTRNGYM
jgi:potassium efflux system protein